MLTGISKKIKSQIYKPRLVAKSFNVFSKTRDLNFYIKDNSNFTKLIKLLENQGLDNFFNVSRNPEKYKGKRFFFATDLSCFDDMADPIKLFAPRIVELLEKHKNMCLFYDLSNESLTFSDDDPGAAKNLLKFHQLILEKGIDGRRVFLLCANTNATMYYENWADKNGINNRLQVLGYSYYFYIYHWQIMVSHWFSDNRRKLVHVANKALQHDVKRKKYYTSMILKTRPHRQALMLMLESEKLSEKGAVSFSGESYSHNLQSFINFMKSIPNGEKMLQSNDSLVSKLPIIFDKDSQTIKREAWGIRPGKIEFLFPELHVNKDIDDFLSYFEIVTETYFSGAQNLYITEKTIRPMIRLQPFILIGSPCSLKYLRDNGFKTFSPHINEEYDLVEDTAKRMSIIFDEIRRLCAMSEEEIRGWYCKMLPVLEHNFNHFLDNTPEMCRKEVSKNIIQFINKA